MTRDELREAVARAILESRLWPGAWDKANEVEKNDARHVADAALAVALPIIREHYAAIAESYEPRCDVCPRGVSTAIRADEVPI